MSAFNFLLATTILFVSLLTHAQTITNVKGSKVLLEIGSEDWGSGDQIYALDEQGKKRGLIQIRQIKGNKAVGEITKGSAAQGMVLKLAKRSAGGGSQSMETTSSAPIRSMRTKGAWGFTASLMMNTMSISNFVQNGQSYSFKMEGMNFGGGLFYDYPLTNKWFVRGHGTLEMFDVKKQASTPICKAGTSTDCNASFMQLGGYGTFNYVFSPQPYRFWAGAGGGAMIYLSKESTVLNTSKFFFNTVLMGAAGFDWFTSQKTFIPLTLEYQMIPDKEAGVSSLVVRFGWGKTF